MKLIWVGLVMLVLTGCTERARQKAFSDPALATKQDVEDIKKLINDRFDRLERKN